MKALHCRLSFEAKKIKYRLHILCFLGLISANFLFASPLFAAAEVSAEMPADARIWLNRSNEEGSDYQNYRGYEIAFINGEGKGAWYYFVPEERGGQGQWHLFHEGTTLDLSRSDPSITEALGYEVVSGSAFFENGPAGVYDMVLDGVTGNLITADGHHFNPHDFEALRDADGTPLYYNLKNGEWWSTRPDRFGQPLSSTPPAPYSPRYIHPDSIPAADQLGSDIENSLIFDINRRLYHKRDDANQVVAFHHTLAAGLRRWDNESDMPCSPYSGMPGKSIVYVQGTWYRMDDESNYYPILVNRYLDFSEQYQGSEFLEYALTAETPLGNNGPLEQQNLRLDGETGRVVDEKGEAIADSEYHSPGKERASCGIEYRVLLNEPLILTGMGTRPPIKEILSRDKFSAKSTKVSLLRVVPLRNRANDPFDDRLLPLAISSARSGEQLVVISPPPAPPPPSGSCPLNTPLTVVASLPASMPLSQSLNLTTSSPYQLGVGSFNAAINIAVINPGNATEATISTASGFTYISGSSLGIVTEGANLSYLLRRNSDSAEFEINFSFAVELVFDDTGISVQTLTGRLCQEGGPA